MQDVGRRYKNISLANTLIALPAQVLAEVNYIAARAPLLQDSENNEQLLTQIISCCISVPTAAPVLVPQLFAPEP